MKICIYFSQFFHMILDVHLIFSIMLKKYIYENISFYKFSENEYYE